VCIVKTIVKIFRKRAGIVSHLPARYG